MSEATERAPADVFADSGRTKEVVGLISAAVDSMSAGTVENLVHQVIGLAAFADQMATPEVGELLTKVSGAAGNLTKLVDTIQALEANGSIDKVVELLGFVRALLDSMNGDIVELLLGQIIKLVLIVDELATSRVMDAVPGLIHALDDTLAAHEQSTQKVTLGSIFKQVRDKQTLETISVLLSFVQRLSPALKEKH